jgi:magnesium-transporting ATPase (P-type)
VPTCKVALLIHACPGSTLVCLAPQAIKALAAALAPKAKALRDGAVVTVESSDLVPGDVIIIAIGNIVPADIKLLGETGENDVPMQVSSRRQCS